MALLGILILMTRFADLYWLIMPAFCRYNFTVTWPGLVVPVSLMALFTGGFAWHFGRYGLRDSCNEEAPHG